MPTNKTPFTFNLEDEYLQKMKVIAKDETRSLMQFHGEDENERYKVLSDLTTQFLNSLDTYKIPTNQLLTLWQHSFTVNATKN